MGEVEIVCTVSVLEPNQEPSKIHWDELVLVREAISRNFLVCVDTELLILMLSAHCLCDLM